MIAGAVCLLAVLGSAYTAFSEPQIGELRTVDIFRASAFVLLAIVLAVRATTPFSFFGRTPVLDDELTQLNRAKAARAGFFMLMLAALAAFVVSFFVPITLAQAAPLMLTLGAAAAALRFATLEGRGDG